MAKVEARNDTIATLQATVAYLKEEVRETRDATTETVGNARTEVNTNINKVK